MALNCRVGDLAYVTSGAKTPGLAGRIVLIEAACDPLGGMLHGLNYAASPDQLGWIVSSANLLPWSDGGYSVILWVPSRIIRDSLLRPIRGVNDESLLEQKPQTLASPQEEFQ